MDAIFDWCVEILVYFAGVFGITYKEINVWVFVIIWLVVTLVLMIWSLVQHKRIRRLENLLAERKEVTMTRKIRLWQIGFLLLLFAAGCAGTAATPYPDEVDWETAVEILNTGEVEMVVQLHSLDVTLTMEDGTEIHTVEPTIDAIFDEIEKCGEPCSQIVIATE